MFRSLCIPCDGGYQNETAHTSSSCKQCPPNSRVATQGATSVSQCLCVQGYSQTGQGCSACPVGTYSVLDADGETYICKTCGADATTIGDASSSCGCGPGMKYVAESESCAACERSNCNNVKFHTNTDCDCPFDATVLVYPAVGIASLFSCLLWRYKAVSKKNTVIYREPSSTVSSALATSAAATLQGSNYIVNVISIDGGGVRGIIPSVILDHIETEYSLSIRSTFHLIGGTSAGGLIALYLTRTDNSLEQSKEMFMQLSSHVFQGSKLALFRITKQLLGKSFYDSARFETVLQTLFGQKTLIPEANFDPDEGPFPLGFAVATLSSVQPPVEYILKTYDFHTLYQSNSFEDKWFLFEAARATSAAPMFFSEYFCHHNLFSDGALFHNNPALVTYREARAIWPQCSFGCFLSIGTGRPPTTGTNSSKSALTWMKTLATIATNSERTHRDISSEVDAQSYFRLNPPLPAHIPIDSSSQTDLDLLLLLATGYIAQSSRELDQLFQRIASTAPHLSPKLASLVDSTAHHSCSTILPNNLTHSQKVDQIVKLARSGDFEQLTKYLEKYL